MAEGRRWWGQVVNRRCRGCMCRETQNNQTRCCPTNRAEKVVCGRHIHLNGWQVRSPTVKNAQGCAGVGKGRDWGRRGRWGGGGKGLGNQSQNAVAGWGRWGNAGSLFHTVHEPKEPGRAETAHPVSCLSHMSHVSQKWKGCKAAASHEVPPVHVLSLSCLSREGKVGAATHSHVL